MTASINNLYSTSFTRFLLSFISSFQLLDKHFFLLGNYEPLLAIHWFRMTQLCLCFTTPVNADANVNGDFGTNTTCSPDSPSDAHTLRSDPCESPPSVHSCSFHSSSSFSLPLLIHYFRPECQGFLNLHTIRDAVVVILLNKYLQLQIRQQYQDSSTLQPTSAKESFFTPSCSDPNETSFGVKSISACVNYICSMQKKTPNEQIRRDIKKFSKPPSCHQVRILNR
ncbi:unnamed protein product [Protopolystoma xenopodis]|uniref:Uncharacterized protein n=1 Tax=Protopolystoma xenopodis TaxID=117903 RepID=A0A448XJ81_9PLAT|nr:unnamed protein product [Protopolystoma xenopodis]